MENLEIAATKSSPEINFNSESNILTLLGESYPENTAKFYGPVFHWLERYLNSIENQEVSMNIELIYFNSSSSKVLFDIFELFENACHHGKNISVNWIYDKDNDAALEYGEDFAAELEYLKFNLLEKK